MALDVPTPVLHLDLDAVERAYLAMVDALPGVEVHYAMKCNPYPEVLRRLRSVGCGFEIASVTELNELRAIGVNPGHPGRPGDPGDPGDPGSGAGTQPVLYSNPVKPVGHIERAYAAGVRHFAFDSYAEADKLAAAAPGSGVFVRLAANRVRSDVPSEGKFGVDAELAAALLLAARDLGLVPYGIAFHVGSQMMSPRAWRAPLETVGEVLAKLAAENLYLEMVNVGGGFPARYDVRPPPLAEYGAVIAEGIRRLPYPVRVAAEPGRALVAEAGVLTATVIGTAVRGGRRWVHLDVGAFNGLMESLETGNRLRFPVRDSRSSPDRELCHLTGPTCDSQDTILFDVDLSADLSVGDLVHIGSTGAYTTVYASTFNGFDVPAVRCGRPQRKAKQ